MSAEDCSVWCSGNLYRGINTASKETFLSDAKSVIKTNLGGGEVTCVSFWQPQTAAGNVWDLHLTCCVASVTYAPGLQPLSIEPTCQGPGTELKALLALVGIKAKPNCSCNKRANVMNEMEAKEPGWCAANIETICDWLQEEATKRKLPFLRAAGKMLVRKAIRNAAKKANNK
jgi:hypothetical protein